MRKILQVVLLLAVSASAHCQTGTIQGHSFLGGKQSITQGLNSSNYLNGIIPGASITVYLTGTQAKAVIYADGSNTPLANPFMSNVLGSQNPGGWIFWAATGQGYDVVASGGMGNPSCNTAPLCYTTPLTLLVDVFAGGGSSSGCAPGGAAGNFLVTNGSGGCAVTNIEVNGAPLLAPSPLNFVNSSTVTFSNPSMGQVSATASAPSSITLQHNDVNLTGLFAANPALLDFNDTTPPPPPGNNPVTFQADPTTGRLSGYVPNTALPIVQMNTIPPDSNQAIPVYFTHCSFATSNPSLTGTQYCDQRSGGQNSFPGGIFNHNVTMSITWDTPVLPAGVNPANVTAVYLLTWAGFQLTASNSITCGGTGSGSANFTTPGFQQQNNLIAAVTGSNIGGLTCTMQLSQSVLGTFGSNDMSQIELWVEYTGSAVPIPDAFNIGEWLVYDHAHKLLTTNPQWPNGTFPISVADLNTLYPPNYFAGGVFNVSDLLSPTVGGACTGGGLIPGQCQSVSGAYQVLSYPGSGGGTTTNPLTANSSGGAAPGTTFDGSVARTFDYHSFGAQQALTLTTTGTSGPATLSSGTLNIPQYTGGGGGGTIPNTQQMLAGDGAGNAVATHMDDGQTTASTITSTEPIAVAVTGGQGGTAKLTEGTAATAAAGIDILYADSTAHCIEYSANGGSFACLGTGGGGGGYTNVNGSTTITSSAGINSCAGSGTCYITTPQSIATGGNVTVPVEFSKAGVLTIASGQTVTFLNQVKQTDGPSQIFTGSGTVVFSSTNSGTPAVQRYAPVEWWGAVGDGSTNNATAIQACFTAHPIQCVFQAGLYDLVGPVTINTANTGIAGAGSSVTFIQNTSASTDTIRVWGTGTGSGEIVGGLFNDFQVQRSVTPTGTPAGLSFKFTQTVNARRIGSNDSYTPFYFNNFANGVLEDATAFFAHGTTGLSNYYCYYIDGANPPQSTYIGRSACVDPNASGTVTPLYLNGTAAASNISDVFVDWLQATSTNGIKIDGTTAAATGFHATDIHINDSILDSITGPCITVTSLNAAEANTANFQGGWCEVPGTNSRPAIDIETSSGVTIAGMTMASDNTASNVPEMIYVNGSSNIGILNNTITPMSGAVNANAILLNNSNTLSILGNQVTTASNRFAGLIAGTTLTKSAISNNTLNGNSGSSTGITFDAASGTNIALNNAFGTLNATVADTAGTNKWCDSTACHNLVSLSTLPSQSADTVVMNATGSSAAPTAVAMPTCTTGADLYNTTTHTWSCVSAGSGGLTQFAQTVVSGSSTSTVTFSSIPGTATNLWMVVAGKTSASQFSENISCTLNGDTTTNHYTYGDIEGGNSTAPTHAGSLGDTKILIGGLNAANASGAGQFDILIPIYTSTTFNKSLKISSETVVGGSAQDYVFTEGAHWLASSPAAVTTIACSTTVGGSVFVAGTTFTLYGMQ